jgi:alkylated DNA repair dioxygenase AlkB
MSQLGFFDSGARVLVDDETGSIVYHPNALTASEAAAGFEALRSDVRWRSERRMMYEREVDVPRLVASFRLESEPLPQPLDTLADRVHSLCAAPFNSVGLNYYRDGSDSVAPHNDTLSELAVGMPIALVSLGATRRMTIRSKAVPRRVLDIDLEAGSILLMSYETQFGYDHAIPKVTYPVGPRISAVFRVRR